MNPEDAVQAHAILQAKRSVGVHWGTWQLTDEGIEEPVQTLRLGLSNGHFVPLPRAYRQPSPSLSARVR